MEAGDGPAGDGDEQEREEARGALRHVVDDRRHDRVHADDDAQADDAERDEQLVAVDVVARL